ncbi:54S ribosomal protein L3 mitochondrial [Elasticomyces elasticus]|nr:54S ribosomal protein L3 mitochondrial [Elasticomyces elasticus]
MKRIRVERWGGQLRPQRIPRTRCPFSTEAVYTPYHPPRYQAYSENDRLRRSASIARRHATSATHPRRAPLPSSPPPPASNDAVEDVDIPSQVPETSSTTSPVPPVKSAKLAALHARLSLPSRLPLRTLHRCLIDVTANPHPAHNNSSLAILGQDLLGYYTAEYLLCKYPRIPMAVLFAAQYAYIGAKTLNSMRGEWGVEAAAAPGEEVDKGLLQYRRQKAGNAMAEDGTRREKDVTETRPTGTGRTNEQWNYRRGISSRIVYDDQFGDLQNGPASNSSSSLVDSETPASSSLAQRQTGESTTLEQASATFIHALAGALYLHCGASATHNFHTIHVISRHLPIHTLFSFKHPTRDLSRLCAREGFEAPVARLISETGRASRHPVFVVGVYSGQEKLGEDAGASLDEGRIRAAAQALRSWYLYSPMDFRVPSEMERQRGKDKGKTKAKDWTPVMIDPGEIIT